MPKAWRAAIWARRRRSDSSFRVSSRQAHLAGVPTLGQLLGRTAPAVDFHAEAVEAERARTVGAGRLRTLGAKPVACFFGPAPGAERRLAAAGLGPRLHLANGGAKPAKCELFLRIYLLKRLSLGH